MGKNDKTMHVWVSMEKQNTERSPTGRLPNEITTEILTRLSSVKTLLQYRAVSKTWCSVIDHPQFPVMHFNHNSCKADDSFSYIMFHNGTPHYSDRVEGDCFMVEDGNDMINFSKMNSIPSPQLFIVGSSNGLVCLSSQNLLWSPQTAEYSIYVWNPATGEYLRLPDIDITYFFYTRYVRISSGFWFDPTTKDFKVLQIFLDTSVKQPQVHIFSLGSNSWKMMKIKSTLEHSIISGPGVFLDESFYWLRDSRITSFDTRQETFEKIPLPEMHPMSTISSRLSIIRGCLSLCMVTLKPSHLDDYMCVWLKRDSWIKEFVLTKDMMGPLVLDLKPCFTRKNGELVLRRQGSVETHVSYNPENGNVRQLKDNHLQKYGYYKNYHQVFPYAGNLLSPKSLIRNREYTVKRGSESV